MSDQDSHSAATALFPLPDMTEVPAIGSAQRDADERFATARARELAIEQDGRLRDALYHLEREIRGPGGRSTVPILNATRAYARELVDHVEQCWASAVIRMSAEHPAATKLDEKRQPCRCEPWAQDHVCGPDCQCGCEAGLTIPFRHPSSAATAGGAAERSAAWGS